MGKITIYYIGKRKTSKTTGLLHKFNEFSVVLDCATEYPQCSLIHKIKKFYPDLVLVRWKHFFLFREEGLLNFVNTY